ncbi:MAG: hypothetical protein HY088_02690 [Ignavibacteriales bacterium]|nr:hypothetical protein [Ignavibacteriales bacterium]
MSQSIIPPNKLKRALKEGKNLIGTMLVEIRQPAVMQFLANAGFDFVLIDNEHGPFNLETIAELSRAAKFVGLTPIVRVPDITYTYVTQALDSGAQGVMIPRITNVQQVKDVIQMMKYPPAGKRGTVLGRGHTEFKSGSLAEMMATANEESLLVVQIETKQALDTIEEIISVPGVDVAFIGPTDLSVALGVPGAMNDPTLIAAIEKIIGVCRRHKIVTAIQANDLDFGISWAKKGVRMVSFNSEAGLMMKAGKDAVAAIGGVAKAFSKT